MGVGVCGTVLLICVLSVLLSPRTFVPNLRGYFSLVSAGGCCLYGGLCLYVFEMQISI